MAKRVSKRAPPTCLGFASGRRITLGKVMSDPLGTRGGPMVRGYGRLVRALVRVDNRKRGPSLNRTDFRWCRSPVAVVAGPRVDSPGPLKMSDRRTLHCAQKSGWPQQQKGHEVGERGRARGCGGTGRSGSEAGTGQRRGRQGYDRVLHGSGERAVAVGPSAGIAKAPGWHSGVRAAVALRWPLQTPPSTPIPPLKAAQKAWRLNVAGIAMFTPSL